MAEQFETRELSPLIKRDQSGNIEQFEQEDDGMLADIGRKVSSFCDFEYSPILAVIFSLNYGVIMGIVAIPRTYFDAGYVASTLIVLLAGVLNYVTCVYAVNMAYRAESIVKILSSHGMSRSEINDNPKAILDGLIANNITVNDINEDINSYTFDKNEFELNKLLGLFCGKTTRIIYELNIIFVLFTASWYYCVAFCVSMARFVGIESISNSCQIEEYSMSNFDNGCRGLYSFYVLVLYIWTMILVGFEFKAQISVQVISFIIQVFVVCILIFITSIGLMYGNLDYDSDSGRYYEISNYKSGQAHYGKNIVAWDWYGIGYMLVAAMWSYTCSFSVPDVIDPLSPEIKADFLQAKKIYLWQCIYVAIICVIGGTVVSVYFGSSTEEACTTAWEYYIGFFWDGGYDNRDSGSYIIAYFVVLLPCFVTLTGVPLVILSLSNTVEEIIFGEKQHEIRVGMSLLIRFGFTTLILIATVFVWDLDLIVVLSGMGMVISCFLCAAYGESMCQHMFGQLHIAQLGQQQQVQQAQEEQQDEKQETSMIDVDIPLSDWTTHKGWIYTVYIVSTFAVIYTIVSTIVDYA